MGWGQGGRSLALFRLDLVISDKYLACIDLLK